MYQARPTPSYRSANIRASEGPANSRRSGSHPPIHGLKERIWGRAYAEFRSARPAPATGWLSFLMLLPFINLIALYVLAFSDWPALRNKHRTIT